MITSKLTTGILLGGALLLSSQAFAHPNSQTRATYKAALASASSDYDAAIKNCATMSGNANDVCVAQAKAEESRAKTRAEASYQGTRKAWTEARIAVADGNYNIAKAKCAAQSGNAEDVCLAQAKAAHTEAVGDAKARKTAGDARAEAREDTMDAQYKTALTKCDALAGVTKDACIADAKAKYGHDE